ncbi:MAG: peptidoglycan DD-metalloendopeptidase family protein [Candidatus Brevundimonas colombiensis]|uniref:Peptidoglycan DD-metalloendopeptidase family protein n=1 Tax=Candidatus Brevundimonas colombiensis TaxID=3121376 RepID=A0AAJ5WX41_9CAUL|nr:peptidoglycan DD-metalloendopeptidase family protein [Brevundimonas sp.]WEK39114.1 MAG: peptidoglycan DD-metalloendopeptidase family protein [Brevundimonas sp.]
MAVISGWMRVALIAGASLSAAACMTYPSEPRYSTHASPAPAPDRGAYPSAGGQQPAYPGGAQTQPYRPAPYESPPPATAPIGQVEGGALPPPVTVTPSQPTYTPPAYQPPAVAPSGSTRPGAAYVIQPGDTISGVGRRFQTPVQTLIDLNGLGPRGAITSGQRIILPEAAVDTGNDPYATGASPVGVLVPNNGVIPPPPPPRSGNAALPVQTRPVTQPFSSGAVQAPAAQGAVATGQPNLLWPVRGDIVRRFGPVGMGERNNGINIGASAGAAVGASAAGRVAYVGSDLVGQGLTVLVVHANGWRTVYGHLGSATVKDGDDVRAGQQVGTVGLTAGDGRPSIHFETRQMRGDDPVAVDPLTVLPR